RRESKIDTMVTQWRLEVTDPAEAHPDESRRAMELYRVLVLPAERAGLLRACRHLVVVADGSLLDVPFAALADRDGRRLIDRFAVSTAFSIGSLMWPHPPVRAAASL